MYVCMYVCMYVYVYIYIYIYIYIRFTVTPSHWQLQHQHTKMIRSRTPTAFAALHHRYPVNSGQQRKKGQTTAHSCFRSCSPTAGFKRRSACWCWGVGNALHPMSIWAGPVPNPPVQRTGCQGAFGNLRGLDRSCRRWASEPWARWAHCGRPGFPFRG